MLTKPSILSGLALVFMMHTSVVAQDKTDFTGQKPTSSQLINALKTNGDTGFKTRGFKTRGLTKRGLDVTSTAKTEKIVKTVKAVNLTIQFELGSVRLTSQARETLEQLGKAMVSSQLVKDSFKIVGHTDATGNDDFNYNLSVDRAQAVTRFLSRQFDIPKQRLIAEGMGEDDLLDLKNPAAAKNRRVEVVNIGQ